MSAEPSDVTAAASRKRLHDLRAPLITTLGFGDELAEAVARLAGIIEAHQQALPAEFLGLTREVLERDINPCLGYLRSSVRKLGDVLDDVSADTAADSRA